MPFSSLHCLVCSPTISSLRKESSTRRNDRFSCSIFFCIGHTPRRLDVDPLAPFVADKIHFQCHPLLLSFRIPHSMIDVTHIHEPSSHTHLIVDDVLHDMCRLALTERQNSIPQTYVLIIILGQRTYVFPSFDVEPFGFFDKESILHIFR